MSRPIAVLVNGEETGAVPVTDRGLQFGDGVFETIAVRDGEPRLLDRHLDRLFQGADRLGFSPPARGVLEEEAARIAAGTDRAVLKMIVTRGSGGRGYAMPEKAVPRRVMVLNPWRGRPAAEYREGAAVISCQTRLAVNPRLAGIKHLNRLEQVTARAEWSDPGIAEGLMRDTGGLIVEGTSSNLFLVLEGTLLTPDLSRCGVAGIMRARVMGLCREAGIEPETGPVRPEQLAGAGEMFLTNSLLGILPVSRLDSRSLAVGPVTRRLMEMLEYDD